MAERAFYFLLLVAGWGGNDWEETRLQYPSRAICEVVRRAVVADVLASGLEDRVGVTLCGEAD